MAVGGAEGGTVSAHDFDARLGRLGASSAISCDQVCLQILTLSQLNLRLSLSRSPDWQFLPSDPGRRETFDEVSSRLFSMGLTRLGVECAVHLFADAKVSKDAPKQVVSCELPRNLTERVLRETQLFC